MKEALHQERITREFASLVFFGPHHQSLAMRLSIMSYPRRACVHELAFQAQGTRKVWCKTMHTKNSIIYVSHVINIASTSLLRLFVSDNNALCCRYAVTHIWIQYTHARTRACDVCTENNHVWAAHIAKIASLM
jgi:hypothetical protein